MNMIKHNLKGTIGAAVTLMLLVMAILLNAGKSTVSGNSAAAPSIASADSTDENGGSDALSSGDRDDNAGQEAQDSGSGQTAMATDEDNEASGQTAASDDEVNEASAQPGEEAMSMSEMLSALRKRGSYFIRCAVLYSARDDHYAASQWAEYLEQPILVNLESSFIEIHTPHDLSDYDLVFLDKSILTDRIAKKIRTDTEKYAEAGGTVVMTEALSDLFDESFTGAASYEKIYEFPEDLELPSVIADLRPLQQLISDYHTLYTSYSDTSLLTEREYGRAMVPDTASVLVGSGGHALYTYNKYGEGTVFFVNPLLPGSFSPSSFSMSASRGQLGTFSDTTLTANRLFLDYMAEYVAKQIYGFAIRRVFGAYGSPSMSLQIACTDITDIQRGSLRSYNTIAGKENILPSLLIDRTVYEPGTIWESMSYLTAESVDGGMLYRTDIEENIFSSGTHIACGDEWLHLNRNDDAASYNVRNTDPETRIFPCVRTESGRTDIYAGSSDGKVYFFEGKGMSGTDGRLTMAEPVALEGVEVTGPSAPAFADLDGDEADELIVGSGDGRIILFRKTEDETWQEEGVLIDTGLSGQCLPVASDIDDDDIIDIVAGSDCGRLLIYSGYKDKSEDNEDHISFKDKPKELTSLLPDGEEDTWLSPHLAMIDNDDYPDLLIGTSEGYIARFTSDEGRSFTFEGFMETDEPNVRGDNRLKFGSFCTPLMTDLNGDGVHDLICGYAEYGLACPVNSPYFPYRERLSLQLEYAASGCYHIGTLFRTDERASVRKEETVLDQLAETISDYGLEVPDGVGLDALNMSEEATRRAYLSIYNAGYKWAVRQTRPQSASSLHGSAPEYVLSSPYYLPDNGVRTLLIMNSRDIVGADSSLQSLAARYDLPVPAYFSTDSPDGDREGYKRMISALTGFRDTYDYNFVRQDQMMKSIAAALNLIVMVTPSPDGDGFFITPAPALEDHALYDEISQSAAGIIISFSGEKNDHFTSNAHVMRRTERGVRLGLDTPVKVSEATDRSSKDETRLLQVSIPAVIEQTGRTIRLEFLDDGLMQVVVKGDASTVSESFNVAKRGGDTVISSLGTGKERELYIQLK